MRPIKRTLIMTAISTGLFFAISGTASAEDTNPVPDVYDIWWTTLQGTESTYAGRTIDSRCHPASSVEYEDPPARNPLPCAADEMQTGKYNYYDRLNWSIAAAERLNQWENNLKPRPADGVTADLNCWDRPVSRDARIAKARELDVNPPPGRKGNQCDYN